MMIIGAEMGLVLGFGVLVHQYVQSQIQPVEVFRFNRDLDENHIITGAEISKVTIPATAITSEFERNPDMIVGKAVGTDVYANNYVYSQQLIDKNDRDDFVEMDMSELRKISIPLDMMNTFGGNLQRGDRVDLMFSGSSGNARYSRVFMQGVPIFEVYDETGRTYRPRVSSESMPEVDPYSGEQIGGSSNGDVGIPVMAVLAVTVEEAEEIEARMNAGNVGIVGRFEDSESYETLGFAYGEYERILTQKSNAETSNVTIIE